MAEMAGVQSLDRAFDIMEQLCHSGGGMAIRQLTEATGLNKSTVHRMLQCMVARGYVIQDPDTGCYRMTTKLYTLGGQILESLDLVEMARRPMEELNRAVGETVHLVVAEGTDIVYVHKVEARQDSVRMASRIGMHRPLYCTGSGKAILAYWSDEEVDRVWANSQVAAYTPYTITGRDDLGRALEEIRRRGISYDNEENELGVRCIAAAIRDYSGGVCGALSISVPQQHSLFSAMETLEEPLRQAQDQISWRMGFPVEKGKCQE